MNHWQSIRVAVLFLCARLCKCSLLSQTTEYVTSAHSYSLCPYSSNDLNIKVGSLNLTQYQRQHKLAHSAHKRLLDNAEVHKLPNQHYGILDRIYEYPLLVPTLAVQRGISNLGDTRRLERFVSKLIDGKAVKIAALGGSVTVGHNVENKKTAWLYRVFDWINTTFPHPEHEFINAAIPAVTSAYVAPCVVDLLPADLDLIFLEFSFNDAERTSNSSDIADTTRIGLERLIRKLLSIESKPAVLNYHYHPFIQPEWEKYYAGVEDVMEMLFGYYGVTSISLRRGLHRLLSDQEWLTYKIWWDQDPVHPTCIGHKFMADLVIGLLQDLAAHLLSTSCCHATHSSSMENLYDKLPPSMLRNGSVESVDKCFLNDNFKALENGIKGFEWVNEGRKPGQVKLGFVSWNVGDSLVIKVPLEGLLPHLNHNQFLLALGVLESYKHMGFLTFDCVNGCSCKQRRVGMHNPSKYSLTYWKATVATLDQGSQQCELYIENINRTKSGEFKNKVTSLMLSSDPHSFIESWANDD